MAELQKRAGAELDDGTYVLPGRELGKKAHAHFFQHFFLLWGLPRECRSQRPSWDPGALATWTTSGRGGQGFSKQKRSISMMGAYSGGVNARTRRTLKIFLGGCGVSGSLVL